MKSKLLLLLFFATAACEKNVDYAYQSTIIIRNSSSHTIDIQSKDDLSPQLQIQIPVGKEHIKSYSGDGSFPGNLLYTRKAVVTFDADIKTLHLQEDRAKYNNFCNMDAFIRSAKRREDTYLFTFTDADYEYARENPMTEQNE